MGGVVASWSVHSSLDLSRPRFEPCPETLCCVLGQDTLLSQCLWVPANGTGEFDVGYQQNAASNPVIDWHPVQEGIEILIAASCY